MRTALVEGFEVVASPSAPKRGVCPACGEEVELRSTNGRWYYRHRNGGGIGCIRRMKPPRAETVVRPGLPGDPYRAVGVEAVVRAMQAARRGNVPAALALAFSPLVACVLDTIGRSPEDLVERVVPEGVQTAPLLVTEDEAAVLKAVAARPGPIFDPRPRHDGHIRELVRLRWYVPLPGVFGPARRAMVARILRHPGVIRAYGLGALGWWQARMTGHGLTVQALRGD